MESRISTCPRSASNPALLRDVVAVGQQIGQHLEPGDDVGRRLAAQRRDRLEHAVDPPPELEPVRDRLEMDVARAD